MAAEELIADNRRARHDYELLERFEAGLVLTGTEVKSLREGRAQLKDSYVAFRAGEAFRPWVLRIVSNEAKNRRRSVGRRERLTVRLAQDRGSGDAAPSPEAAALGHEDREALLGAIERLSEPERLVVTYRYLLELSEAETARALAIRPGTVKSRLSRALGRLRDQLEGSRDG